MVQVKPLLTCYCQVPRSSSLQSLLLACRHSATVSGRTVSVILVLIFSEAYVSGLHDSQ